MRSETDVSRRRFLALGGAAVAAGAVAPWIDPLEALGATSWPQAKLTARDAVRVRPSQFMPTAQFRAWNTALDKLGPANQKGLRATATSAHEGYIDDLAADLERAGIDRSFFSGLHMQRWTTATWSLDVVDGPGAGPVRTAAYINYSGQTPADGVTAPLALVEDGTTPAPGSLAGKIAVFDVPTSPVTYGTFTALAYPGRLFDPAGALDPNATYNRPYLAIGPLITLLDALAAAGAVGAVGVLDYPANGADGSYFPYDGIIRSVPGVYVDRATGAPLKDRARAGVTARLALPAQVKRVKTRNLIGFVNFGSSDELVCLHCHSDGSNAIEDNGPQALVAATQYLSRLPRNALPRTVMILLTTGHFAGGNGSQDFCRTFKNDLVKRTNAAITIEHLGLKQWEELPSGQMGPTGQWEAGAVFAPGSKALVDDSFTALRRGRPVPASVLKPLNPDANGTADAAAWPGEGQYLYALGHIADANFITGPTYLLNWGITTKDKCDHAQVRRQAKAFTQEILRLARTPRRRLTTYTL